MAYTFKGWIRHKIFGFATYEKYYRGNSAEIKCWVLRFKFKKFLIELKWD